MVPAERMTGATLGRSGRRPRRGPAAPTGRELDHRIANSLQLAVDFLVFQQTRLTDPRARAALIDAAERLVAVGHLHRFLVDHGAEAADAAEEIDLERYFEELAALIAQSTGLRCRVDAEPIRAPASLAQQLGLAVNELATNAAKHAYLPGETGDLVIEARREAGGLRLTVADFGVGLGTGFDLAGPAEGLGLGIVGAIAREIGARLEARDGRGARFTLVVPLEPLALGAPPLSPSRSFAPPSPEDA
jgi:two-component sensor histidine kinase